MSANPSDYSSYFGKNFRDQLVKESRRQQNRVEELEVPTTMKLKQEDIERSLKALQVRKTELREKEGQMKEQRQKFENHLKEIEMRRSQATRKAEQEREASTQKQAELCALREEMKALVNERDRLEKRVQKNVVFPRYLDKVVQASKQEGWYSYSSSGAQFQEPRQLISHCENLMKNREELVRASQQNQDDTESARTQLARFTNQSNITLLQHNNHLAQLQSQLDKARVQRMTWESRLAHIQNTASQKTLLLGTIKMATLNLYQSVCKETKKAVVPTDIEDTLKQLEKIRAFLSVRISIREVIRKQDQMAASGKVRMKRREKPGCSKRRPLNDFDSSAKDCT